ncbi:LCP family protein [Exiguobacterium aurantiacum]|uniref:Membrane-bound protein lytR n=1 Tax=Exiguobacterium aurantiacum TaxID=33987 RepID=A0A377FWE0_9BACL|nr:LCP family protein [Exiguobacterium aurantiacum]STO09088.1 Membrane-bound protein lytR [Exiguobacterium aurantiacum]
MNEEQRLSRVERRKRELEHESTEDNIHDEQIEEGRTGEVTSPTSRDEDVSSDHPFLNQSNSEQRSKSTDRQKQTDRHKQSVRAPKPKWTLPLGKKRRRKREDGHSEPRAKESKNRESRREAAPPREKPVKEKRKRRGWKGKFLLLLLLFFIVVGYLASNPFTFLVMGSDARVGESVSGSRTDSLQLIEFVPRSRTVQNVSIPRDTYTAIPCEPDREGDKITHAFAYGGASCTVGAVEGLTEASVDGQVVITFETFMELIDTVGGVNVTATHSFSEKGFNQTYEYTEGVSYSMDGDMALAYARHRKSDTDGARSSRQTEVMTAVADKLASPSGWTKIPATYRFMKNEMGLEMNPLQMASVGLTMLLKPDVNKMQVEGQDAYINNVYYYQPTETSVQAIRDALDLTMWGTVR